MSLKEEGGRKKEEIQAMQDARVPEGWVSVGLVDISSIEMGQSPESSSYNSIGEGLPFFQGKAEFRSVFPEIRKWCTAPAKVVEAGDILLSIRAPVGPTNIAPQKSCIGRGLAGIRGEAGVNQHYLYYFFKYIEPWLSEQGTGSTFAAISGQFVREISCPVAPASEQIRIVAKLKELLADLDAGVAELKAAQKKLAQYQQSLLKSAVEGQLTADWRAQHPPTETGAELLARILQERRTRWEAKQLEKFAQQGKAPPKNWQSKYPEPIPPDTRSLPTLPEGWVWATLSQIGWLDRGRSKYRPRNAPHLYGGAYPFVQTGDIRHADTHLSKVEVFYSKAGLTQSRLWPAGTMCITIAANIGKTAILSMDACFPDSIVGFLPVSGDVSVRYVEYFMRSAQQKLEDEAPATAQKNINLEILEKVVIPLPPPIEQQQIVKSLDETMGGAKENNSAIEIVLKQTTAQRQNILRAAFAGELVPQDPSDEPASALLERIRAQRAAQTPDQKPRGRKKKEIQDA